MKGQIKKKILKHCKDYGVYIDTCVQCTEICISQISNSFAKRWSSRRTTWKNNAKKDNEFEIKDTLVIHYKKVHKETILIKSKTHIKYNFYKNQKKRI